MTVQVRSKKFEIDLVSNWVLREYAKLHELSIQLVHLQVEIAGKAQETADAIQQVDDVEKAQEMQQSIIDMKDKFDEKQREIVMLRNDIVRELLESNDIEYDGEWWDRRTGTEDINDFLLTCVNKDVKSDGKRSKKK